MHWARPIAVVGLGATIGCGGTTPPGQCSLNVECPGAGEVIVRGPCGRLVLPTCPTLPADAGAAVAEKASEPAPGVPPFAMIGGNPGHTQAVDRPAPKTAPKQLWEFKTAGPIVGSPIIGPTGTVFIASHDRYVYAVNPDGSLAWKFQSQDRVWSTPAVSRENTVYFGSDDDHLYAIDGGDGALKWRYRIGNCEPGAFGPEGVRCDADGGPTLGMDGTVYVGGDGVYAIWPNGTLRWKLATGQHVRAAPALGHDGTVVAGCLDDAVYGVRSDGTRVWTYRTHADVESTPTIGPDGTVYVGSDDRAVYALGPDGTLRWKVVTGGAVRSSAALAADGTVYIGSYDRNLYAIRKNGEVKWRFATADRVHSAPLVASNGVILFGSQDAHLYAVDEKGVLLWTLEFADDVDTTPAIAGDGTVYVAGDDGILRAFR